MADIERRPAHRWALGATIMALALIGAACGGGGGSSKSAAAILRLGQSGQTGSLNLFSGLQGEYATFTTIYPTLVRYELKTADFKPGLATRWESSDGDRTWTFHLHPGARWSDGHPLTAADVAFTLDTIRRFQDGATANYAGYVSHLQGVDTPDAATVVLHYDQPVGNVLAQAGVVQLLPEHVWATYATGDGKALTTFPNGPPVVSGGPFTLNEQRKDEVEQFVRNAYYFGERPTLAGFGVRFFANDDALVAALKNGEIDAIQSLPATSVDTVRATGATVATTAGIGYDALAVNPTPGKTKNRELLDPKVRQALEYAVDRERIASVVYLGHAKPGSTIVPVALTKWHDDGVKPLPFDVAKANQLLDEAGFARGPDGTRAAGGHPMTYEVLVRPDAQRTFEIIQAGFRQVGINLTPRTLDRKALSAAVASPDGKYLDYDFAITSGSTGGYDPDFGLSAFACFALGQFNPSGYCNPEYDKLYKTQSAASVQQRIDLVHKMQDMIYESRAVIVLTYPDHIDAWAKGWTGLEQSPEGIFSYLSPDTLVGAHRSS
jgi:peptide/nickel transport system substrate-binding protein